MLIKILFILIGIMLLMIKGELAGRPRKEYVYTRRELRELREIEKQLKEL